jgi:MFS superfamily sulfate permease-like transporter
MLIVDSFVTAIVSYVVSMSMALILAEGEDYVIDPNQELLALVISKRMQ